MNETNAPTDTVPGAFPRTHWSVVLSAAQDESAAAHEALARLCETYWFPLYAFARRKGHSPEDAQDLTQAFFLEFIEHDWVARADPQKGRFRFFLLVAMRRFMSKEWQKARSIKRGGQVQILSLEMNAAETRYALDPADPSTPELVFEKQWALTLLDTVLHQLQAEYEQAGKGELFAAIKPCLIGRRESQPYAELAVQIGMSEGAIKVAVHRLRERYREFLREEVARTVASPEDVEAELRHLFRALGRG